MFIFPQWWWWFCRSVVTNSLRPHELQHARLPRPSVSPRVCSDSCLLSLVFSLYSELMVSCLSIVALCTSKTSSAAADQVVTVLFSKHFVHLTPWTLNSGCASVSWAALSVSFMGFFRGSDYLTLFYLRTHPWPLYSTYDWWFLGFTALEAITMQMISRLLSTRLLSLAYHVDTQ